MKTGDHKSYHQCGATGTMSVRRSELWTVSKFFGPERRHLL